jgi:hypothetical protein
MRQPQYGNYTWGVNVMQVDRRNRQVVLNVKFTHSRLARLYHAALIKTDNKIFHIDGGGWLWW